MNFDILPVSVCEKNLNRELSGLITSERLLLSPHTHTQLRAFRPLEQPLGNHPPKTSVLWQNGSKISALINWHMFDVHLF